jgi:hypothetical protein
MQRRKIVIKPSALILIALFAIVIGGVFATNIIFKQVYDKVDKSDLYWNYNTIFSQPYKYLKIDGGNITQIMFEPGKRSSVRVLNYWNDYIKDSTVKCYVKNDTLHLKFLNKYRNEGDKWWMGSQVLVRLFAPELLAVDGNNTHIELQKMKQASINIDMKGKSSFELESYVHDLDSLHIKQSDSSQAEFEMAPELPGSHEMNIKYVSAAITGHSILDVGHGYIDNLKYNLADSSAIILSGRSLKKNFK